MNIISEWEIGRNLYPKYKPHYFILNGCLMHVDFVKRLGRKKKLTQNVVPDKFKTCILTGHIKTYNAVREKYFWKSPYSDTKIFTESCKSCMTYKSPNRIAPTPIGRSYLPTRQMEYIFWVGYTDRKAK